MKPVILLLKGFIQQLPKFAFAVSSPVFFISLWLNPSIAARN
jgi:hypothetical protein